VGMPLIDTIDRLLEVARPTGQAHRRLLKYRDQVTRNVFLGPSVMRYINGLVEKLDDKIECRYLTQLGKCRSKKRVCDHLDDNSACPIYKPNKKETNRRYQ